MIPSHLEIWFERNGSLFGPPRIYSTVKNQHILLPRDAMRKCSLCHRAVSVRPSVRVSVTFVYSVETNKHIFKLFPPSGNHTILVFPYQTIWQHPNGFPLPSGGVECTWGEQKSRFSTNIWPSDRWLLHCDRQLRRSTVQFTSQIAKHQSILFM